MKEGDRVAIFSRDGGLEIGSWTVPGVLIDNFEAQKDLGWHIFFELNCGAGVVIVKLATAQPEPEEPG